MKTILCVEDHQDYQFLISKVLKEFIVLVAPDLKFAQDILNKQKVDLILLDIHLPDGDGLKFFSLLQSDLEKKAIPVIFLSSANEVASKVLAFNLGAEDYICKPVDPSELKARVQARLKKSDEIQERNHTLRFKDLMIEIEQQRAFIQHPAKLETLDLTPKEFRLLSFLAQNFNKVFSREQLLSHVWGTSTNVVDRTVDTHLSNLRKKISTSSVTIVSIINEGYRMTYKGEEG